MVIVAGAVCSVGAIESNHPYDLASVSGVFLRQAQAVEIFIRVSRRIFFIASCDGQHDIDCDKCGHPAVITVGVRRKRLKRVLPLTIDRHGDTIISRTHVSETADIIWLTGWAAAV